MPVLVATADGLHEVRFEGRRAALEGREVTAVDPAGWALLEGREVVRRDNGAWTPFGVLPEAMSGTCLVAGAEGVMVGTKVAHLVAIRPDGAVQLESFERAPTRDEWYTPWGGPPDVRSLALDDDGTLFVNVHVGGILRSGDGDAWEATIDLHEDVHQVVAVRGSKTVVAASGAGLAVSDDAGSTWAIQNDGLHATYLRAVAVSGDAVLVSASYGPGGQRSMLYRRSLAGRRFEPVGGGLPDEFTDNIDTGWLAADGDEVALATPEGAVFMSHDAGRKWSTLAEGLPAVHMLAFADG